VARGTSGRLRFAPAEGRAGRRKIVAQVTQAGMPRTELTVAGYRAGTWPPRKPRRLRLAEVGRKGAARVSVVTLDSAGRRSSARTKAIGKWPKRPRA